MSITVVPAPALTGFDRCDRCGAGAKVRAVLTSGAELLFCGHHARLHAARLRAMAADLHGDRAALRAT